MVIEYRSATKVQQKQLNKSVEKVFSIETENLLSLRDLSESEDESITDEN